MPSRRNSRILPENTPGIHILRDHDVLRRLIHSAAVGSGDLVLEFGAGTGVLTTALASTGARVIAIERHPGFVDRLHTRFGSTTSVRVVAADARTVPLPRRPYAVVANIPFSISTVLLRRLLTPEDTALTSADLIVEWGFAKRVTASPPRDIETAWWHLRYELRLVSRVPGTSFAPRAAVDAAHLVVRRRTGTQQPSPKVSRSVLHAVRHQRKSRRRL